MKTIYRVAFFPVSVYVWYWVLLKGGADRIADVLLGRPERIPGVKYSLDSRMWFRGHRLPPEIARRFAVVRIKGAATLGLIVVPLLVMVSLRW
ncbi:MAG: hypothetical protein AABY65_11960 [Nitrospirota bacterium]